MIRARTILTTLAVLLPLTGCATSQTRDVCISPDLKPDVQRSVAIIACDETGRMLSNSGELINVEDRLAAELGRRGYETTLQSNLRQYVDQQAFRSSGLTDADYATAALHADADAILIARVTQYEVRTSDNSKYIPFTINGQRMGPTHEARATVSLRMIDANTAAQLFTATSDATESVPDTNTYGTVAYAAAATAAQKIPSRLLSPLSPAASTNTRSASSTGRSSDATPLASR